MASHPPAFGMRPLAAVLGLATLITLQGGSAYAQPVAAAWVGGRVFVANIRHREDPAVTTMERLAPDGTLLERHEYASTGLCTWFPGIVFGADVAVPIGRVVVVPEARLIAFPLSDVNGDYIARGGVSCRWRFGRS